MGSDLIGELKTRQGGMSQTDFADLLGVSDATLSRIYSGERLIGEETGRRIAKAFPELQWIVAGFLMGKGVNG